MAKKKETPEENQQKNEAQGDVVEQQAQQQTGQQVRVRIDERELTTGYANAFRTNATAEEVILDFGLNNVNQTSQQQETPEIIFRVEQRVIMNYYSAKRLAITLSQLIRRHEEQFGELQLDVASRRQDQGQDQGQAQG